MSCFNDGIKDVSDFFSGIFTSEETQAIMKPVLSPVIDTLQTATKSVTHVVRRGDTLSKIADKYKDVTYQDIAKANGITNPNSIYVGQRLNIPKQTSVPQQPGKPTPVHKPISDDTCMGESKEKRCEKCEITVDLLNELIKNSGEWFMGKGSKSKTYRAEYATYTDIHAFDKKKFISILKLKMKQYNINKSCYHVAHFLSQIIHESAHFDTTLEYGSGHNYEPGIHRSAIKNGNIHKGDGKKYRGRGLIQLTWKNNYRAYGKSRGVDFVKNPESIGNTMENAIDASCWYWRHHGAIYKKYNAKGDINILIDNDKYNVKLITLAVNGGKNGLSERQQIFTKLVKKWKLK